MPPKRLVSPTGRAKVLAPVRPNEGLEAEFRRRLDRLIAEMNTSILYWVKAQWRAKPPEMAADDDRADRPGSPASGLRWEMERLGRQWEKRFDDAAPELAKYFSTAMMDRSDAALRGILKRAGFSVKFSLSRAANDALQGTIGEQTSLIKSIASEHLTNVQGIVLRGVTNGRDLGYVAKELEHRYAVTKRRAAFIARDQMNKSTATITRVRQQELGITEAIWTHSAGGRQPRPAHVKAGRDRLRYDVSKGALIDGEYIYPGQLINCRCTSRAVIPGFE